MHLNIKHTSVYDYHKPVEINPHQIFLKPLERNYLEIKNFKLEVSPVPVGMNERNSIEDNPYFQVWFSGETDKLITKTTFEAISTPFNPFSFLVDHWFIDQVDFNKEVPFSYLKQDLPILYAYLLVERVEELKKYCLARLSQKEPISFLTTLNADIHENWEHIIREEETLWSPSKTFLEKKGSCRDLSWMMIQMLRNVGLASRFVSGYAFNPEMDEGHELHAWVEVYLPGAGWVGIDPNLGLLTDEHYIPLASSFLPGNTLPIHGTYGGKDLEMAELSTEVIIEVI
ncbi:MAG: transglutaminase family protein [Cyclobacteriaceae bacterium]